MSTALTETTNGVVQLQQKTTAVVPGGTSCPALSQALASARDRCKAASKDGKVAFGATKYDYATSDEVIDTARGALEGSGLAVIPVSQELTVVAAGPRSFYALNRTMILSHTSGEFTPLELRGWPVIEDKGRPLDKALAVALTTSLAYMLRDLLQIPRGEQFDDMDQRDDTAHVPQPVKHTPAGAAKVLQDAGLPVQFGSQIQQPTPTPSPPITREQADALGELVDGTFLESNDFLIVYGIDKLTDITQDSYAEVLQAARQVDAIRQLAVELNISPSKMLAPYADGTDGEPFFLALTEQQRADISMNLIKTKESRARKQQKQTA